MKFIKHPKSLNYKSGDFFLNKINPKLAFEFTGYNPQLGIVEGKIYELRRKNKPWNIKFLSIEELTEGFVKVKKSDIIKEKPAGLKCTKIPDRFDSIIN